MELQLIRKEQAQPPFFVGVDLGGTNIKAGVTDDRGAVLWVGQEPTHVERGPEDGARRIADLIHRAIHEAGLTPQDIAGVGLGSAGTMDIPGGRLVVPPNLKGWEYFPIRDRVSEHTGMPITFANDATAAAFGEKWVGAGQRFHSMILLTLGTGIGCGIIVGDLLLDGEHSHGGEYGHTVIDYRPDARVCSCGRRGHFEAYASATAVTKRAEEALAQGRVSMLTRRIQEGAKLDPKLIAEMAEAGDELSRQLILETAEYLGIGIVNLMHTIDPNGILIGGAMTFGGKESRIGRIFLERVKHEIFLRAYPAVGDTTEIDFATLGGNAGFIGAAGIARLEKMKAQFPPAK
ncbi:MAG: ROK family protein [Thermogutta sp.]